MAVARRLGALALGALLGGCSLGGPIAEHALDYNRTVGEAENAMFLLNVVRASREHPLHFTRIARISGAFEAGADALVAPTLGDSETGFFDLTLSAGATTRPSFDVQILDSERFYAGLQSPLTAERFNFFRERGYPLPLLLHAVVERAAVSVRLPTTPGGTEPGPLRELCTLENDPTPGAGGPALEDDAFARFDALVSLLAGPDGRVDFVTQERRVPVGPPLPARALADPGRLRRLRAEGFEVARVPGAPARYRLFERTASSAFRIDTPARLSAVLERARGIDDPAVLCSADAIGRVARLLRRRPPGGEARASAPEGSPYALNVEMTLRSTRGLIQYLGELVRAQTGGRPPAARAAAALATRPTLFRVTTAAIDDPALAVDFRGETYSVPPYPEGGRSLQLLALVKQLFTLNLSAEEFPRSQVVRFID